MQSFIQEVNFEGTVQSIFFHEGMISVLSSSSYNVGILVFLVILGAMVCLMNRAGGSAAFGRWAGKSISEPEQEQSLQRFFWVS